jgi:asparagine synthase (glutamine-hydrolysing)
MCGISGKISTKNPIERIDLEKSALTIRHRGPDDQGTYLSSNHKVGFAHRRLSLLDLSNHGHQPMSHQNTTIVFNGEIYNFVEIRKELEGLGVQFESVSDTEVILLGYQVWGKEVLHKLKGMFAFAIHDEERKEVFLARDRFGIKPLFYAFQNGNFYFGSEIKAIHSFEEFEKKIEPSSISLFLANRFVSDNQTMWKGLYKLPAAHYMLVHTDTLQKEVSQYWSLERKTIDLESDYVQNKFEDLFTTSLLEHLRSDVPVGAFLSGGLDSSATVMLMQTELKYTTQAFSIGFNDWEESEDRFAKMVTDFTGAELETLVLDKIDLEIMPTLMYHYDDPIADISILPTYSVSQLASKRVKAVISGEGADELLGGYWWQKPENFQPGGNFLHKWLSKFSNKSTKDIKNHYINAMSMGLFDSKELRKGLSGKYQEAVPKDVFAHLDGLMHSEFSTLKQIQYLDIHRFMGELVLTKIDRASMAHSLEVRVPFLDHELVEWLFSLPENRYMQDGVQKLLLQNLLKGRVPDKILQRPKQGFVGPDVFYKNFELYKSTLLDGSLVKNDVVKRSYIQQLLLTRDHWRLWKLYVLEHWWRVWM